MKKLLTLFLTGLLFTSCADKPSYTVKGKAEGVSDGTLIRLAKINEVGKQVIKDSAVITNEEFTLKGAVEEPNIYFLALDGTFNNAVFMLENSDIQIDFNKEVPMESKVTGSESNAGYEAFQNEMLKFREEGSAIMSEYNELGNEPAPEKRDSIAKAMDDLRKRQINYPLIFIQEHKDSYFSLNLVELESSRPGFNVVEYREAFENFTSKLKDSKKGVIVKQKLDKLYEEHQKTASQNN
ncbi:DUF4369 domain-containing protein [Winogradskyella pulchriflava]|uniref:DUF4369 domain-containing protein n=1 Tax=Winogradskyella pulchriflava TaxID=1110688 RepID=A0ABV6Q9J1_9FLAO